MRWLPVFWRARIEAVEKTPGVARKRVSRDKSLGFRLFEGNIGGEFYGRLLAILGDSRFKGGKSVFSLRKPGILPERTLCSVRD
jgi:hypothetical protein